MRGWNEPASPPPPLRPDRYEEPNNGRLKRVCTAMNTFDRDGITFQYPANWTAEVEETTDGGWAVTVTSPQTAFLFMSLCPEARDLADLADQTLDALKADYAELDFESRVETVAGQMAIGYDIDLLTLDTPVEARLRCLETPAGPLLVLTQTAEPERERNAPLLQAMIASLTVAED